MRKIVPLVLLLWCVLLEAHGQAPEFHPYLAIVSITEGSGDNIQALAHGAEPISYQWQKDGVDIPGATNYVYGIAPAVMSDAGAYTLIASNAEGSATATIDVTINENLPPSEVVIDSPVPGFTFTPGTEFSFSGFGNDPNEDWTLQSTWDIEYHDNGNVAPTGIAYLEQTGEGETAGYFFIPPDLVPSAGAFYRIRLTVRDQLNESLTTYIDIPWSGQLNTTPPEIEEHPESVTVEIGSAVTLYVNARFATSYQWTFEGSNIPGATNQTYIISNAQYSHTGTYQVLVSNAAGTTVSNAAEVSVEPGNSAPMPAISGVHPEAYIPGQQVLFEGFATDPYPTMDVELIWRVALHRGNTVLPGPPVVVPEGSYGQGYFIVPPQQELQQGDFFRLHLTAKDAEGLTGTTYRDIHRDSEGVILLKTNPANLTVLVSDVNEFAPFEIVGPVGQAYVVEPSTPQTVNGVTYAFSNWAHGGNPEQSLILPYTKSTYTLNYSSPVTGPWRKTEVGAVEVQGNASFSNGTFTLSGAGSDIWGTADAFRMVYQSFTGNVDIRARVTGLTNTHSWAKAGVMIRRSMDPKSAEVMTAITPGNGATFQHRTASGGTTTATGAAGSAPRWVRLVRIGNTFTSYISPDGMHWMRVGSPTSVTMNDRVYVGLAVTSHRNHALCTATFTNVTVTVPTTGSSLGDDIILAGEETFMEAYPNPVNGNTLHVNFSSASPRKLQVINLLGQVLLEHNTGEGASSADIDVTNILRGVYVLSVSDKQRRRTLQFVRQ